jgi:hypothetical protein
MNKFIYTFIFILIFRQLLASDYKVVSDSITFENKADRYSVKVLFPVITGFANKETEKDFNKYVKEFAQAHADTFKMEMKEWEGPGGDFSSEYELGYSVYYNDDGLISILLNVYSYYAGAAHPNTYFYSVNYDLKKNKQLKLSNLFGGNYLKVISGYCIADLKKQASEYTTDVDMPWINEGAGPKKENFAVFNNTDTTFVVTFPAYQVGSYAEGPKEIEIPFSKLADVIDKDGPYAKFIK